MIELLKGFGAILLLVFAWMSPGQFCLALEENLRVPTAQYAGCAIQPASCAIESVRALVPHRVIKSTPSTFEVYQYDESPLGHREPLLLIHGLVGEYHPLFRWGKLAGYLSRDQAFQQRYKLYLVRYNTRSSVKELAELFSHSLRRLAQTNHLTIVTVSLSGQIVRDAMKDPAVEQSISRVLTMGAFFRGSPLFCADWMKQSIMKRHLSPLCRMDRWLGYKLYFSLHKNLPRDYAWDNTDGQRPAVGQSNVRSDYDTALSSPMATPRVVSSAQPGDRKFIVYAGYIHNQYVPRRHGAVRVLLDSPYTLLRTTLPAHLGEEHAALRFLNHIIAGAIPGESGRSEIIYPFNDGISPISSSLLLSDDFVAQDKVLVEEDLYNLGSHSNAKKSRLFDNIDHLTFIESRRPKGSSVDVTDVLSPTEKPRPMFAWIVNDLLECQ